MDETYSLYEVKGKSEFKGKGHPRTDHEFSEGE